MVTHTYGNCLLTPCLHVLPIPTPICLFFQQFFSLFSVCLLTFQEVEPSVHAGFGAMGCSCQLVGGRDREQRNLSKLHSIDVRLPESQFHFGWEAFVAFGSVLISAI
jgi:hypothetical protein